MTTTNTSANNNKQKSNKKILRKSPKNVDKQREKSWRKDTGKENCYRVWGKNFVKGKIFWKIYKIN